MAYAKDENMETRVRSRKTDSKATKVNNGKVPKSFKEPTDNNLDKEVLTHQDKPKVSFYQLDFVNCAQNCG